MSSQAGNSIGLKTKQAKAVLIYIVEQNFIIMASIFSLIIIVTLSILITRIATIALTHTGLTHTVANFQARSAFTGVGFTTNEAENITEHPVRRKIIMLLMLLGNVGIISAISSLIITFVDPREDSLSGYSSIIIIAVSMLILWLLSQSKYLDKGLKKVINRALSHYTNIRVRDYNQVLNLSGEYEITELKVQTEDWMADRSLAETALKDEGIFVIGIRRSDGSYLGLPDGGTGIETGDTLVLYGREKQLRQLDERKRGEQGNQEHESSSREQQSQQAREKALDQERKRGE
jgi:K+/H+ antiporter YhaU regulatory subunit KhtT